MSGRPISIEYRVPYADVDQMGIVYYANYLVYFERLRNELIRESGITYREIEAAGLALPVIEAHAEYQQPARYDDLITITGFPLWARGARLRIDYEITNDGKMLVTGYTVHATVSPEGRPRRVPPQLLQFFSE